MEFMYRLVLLFLLMGNALWVGASPLWMRYCAISPDGEKIAFAYKGDIYVVGSRGGEAFRLTTGDSYESSPVWSHDGRKIAFVSDREGGMDIFVTTPEGGVAQRVTTHSAKESLLAFSPDDRYIYFSATIQDPASSALFPDAWITELYRIPVEGGRPEQVLAAPVCNLSFAKDGKSFIYENRTGSENIWRKHHTSSVARDIFYYDAEKNTHTLLTSNPGEDRSPIYLPDGRVVFLSERDGGSFNVYRADAEDMDHAEPLTAFKQHPVRFLTCADNGTLCFGYQGEIYTLAEGGKPQKVEVEIVNDLQEEQLETLTLRGALPIMPNRCLIACKSSITKNQSRLFAILQKYGFPWTNK